MDLVSEMRLPLASWTLKKEKKKEGKKGSLVPHSPSDMIKATDLF